MILKTRPSGLGPLKVLRNSRNLHTQQEKGKEVECVSDAHKIMGRR